MTDRCLFRLAGLQKIYGARRVLDIGQLDVQRGQVLALVGPSGAGKSTLLRLLNFLEAPSAGSLEFDGLRLPPGQEAPLLQRRRVTTVFQRPVLLNRSVWDNVEYSLRLRGQRDIRAAVQAVLEQVGLLPLARQAAHSLSGGEAQRVALARALVIRPDVLLLDEPTANLDPYNVGLIEDIVRRENESRATTVVLVTHNVFQARRLAQRVAFMLAGRLVETADVHTFFHSPADERTRRFINGEMVY
jgi:tungstate transport system ATP-binding protein